MLELHRSVMSKERERHRLIVWSVLYSCLIAGVFMIGLVTSNLGLEEKDIILGATFSTEYAKQLGIDPEKSFLAAMDDLKIRNWRLPAYWNQIEPEPHVFDFTKLDRQLEEVSKRNGRVILAIGRKLPRWPECHAPTWTKYLPEEIVRERLLESVGETVKRYRKNGTIVAWQVENEPFFSFGECPKPDAEFLKEEIALVKSLDSRPVMITESGELSTWVRAANLADILGISTYRIVWIQHVGHFFWPVTPEIYRRRAIAVRQIVPKIVVSELQAEPWTTSPIQTIPLNQQTNIMNADRLLTNVTFAKKMGVDEAYLWGVEWWYWLKQKGQPEMWEAARKVFR